MTEASKSFTLHPSILIAAVLPESPHRAQANRLLGEVAMGRSSAYAAGGPALLEFQVLSTLIASKALIGFSVEDLANVLRDLRQQLAEANLYGRLLAEPLEPYRLASTWVALRHDLDIYAALTITVAGTKGVPLLVDGEALFGQLQLVALAQPRLRIVRLQDYL